jgi:tRNA/rRNA methyltransferase
MQATAHARCPTALYNIFLTTEQQHASLEVVLVRPRNPLNIGAAARACANFGFTRLTVVDPYDPTWRAARSAVDSEFLLASARLVPTLAEAVAGATLVLGTGSVDRRKSEQPVVSLPALAPVVEQELSCAGRVALVFGSEKHGLTREDLVWCHQLVAIPTSPLQPSMNLGQSVAVCLYELATRVVSFAGDNHILPTNEPFNAAATDPQNSADTHPISGDLDRLAGLIEETMTAARYSPASMRAANQHDLRLALRRMAFTHHDLRRALGLFRRILWRIGH